MPKKRFVIIGASNERFGDFVFNHWSKSLIDHIDNNKVDIVILDYGLSSNQRKKLVGKGIRVVKCKKDGHIVNLRYRDILNFLIKNKYDQVLACDAGDIIFQKDIMSVFNSHPNQFRGVIENLQPPTLEYSLVQATFSQEDKDKILRLLKGKKMVNGGFVIAPRNKFITLCTLMLKMIKRMDSFGPDQIILNYVLYREGFFNLDVNFNYIPVTAKDKFKIKEGVFYNGKGEVINVIHNAGNKDFFRVIDNFGYGKGYNKFKFFPYIILKIFYKIVSFYRGY